MPEPDPLADVFTLFAAPVAGAIRSVEQFRTAVDEFLRGVENFNRTMENLNETTERINSLLADVEEPIRASVPQFTRSIKAADEMMQVVSGPAIAAAPAFQQIADTIATPAFQQLPDRVTQFNEMMNDMSRRLGPLTQLAETAGGLFGGFRLPGTASSARTEPVDHDDEQRHDPPLEVAEPPEPAVEPEPTSSDRAEKTAAKKPAKKKPAARKPAKKKTSKKPPAKKSAANKSAAKKPPPDKTSADASAGSLPADSEPTRADLWG